MTGDLSSAILDPLSPEGLNQLLRQLPEPTPAEAELITLVEQVDLSGRSGTKWGGVATALGSRIKHATRQVPPAGGGGMATYANRNQFANRMRQAGVAGVDTTVFVIGDPELLRLSVSELASMLAMTTTSTQHAVVVFRGQGTCRVVRLLAIEPGTDEITEVLRALAPAAPVQLVTADVASAQSVDAAYLQGLKDSAAESVDASPVTGSTSALGIPTSARAWFVTDAGEGRSEYANVDGNSYQYMRTTRAGRDEVAAGHWFLLYRLVRVGAADAGHIYGVARIHQVHRHGDIRYAIFDRFHRLDPAVPLSVIGGDPRPGAQIAITSVGLDLVAAVLSRASISHIDQLSVPAMRLGVQDVFDRLSGLRLPDGVVEQCVAALRGGKHLILRGPPGTGKSTLAIALGRAAHDVGLSRGQPIVTTATSDWTSTDTVGGYRLDPQLGPNGLAFQAGFMLEAVDADTWLVIDELNRSDIDKAIGQFFSLLSGQPTLLPYVDADGVRLGVSVPGSEENVGPYTVTEQWRLITTMNERDRDLLFNLSEALLRRFAVVNVPAPTAMADWDWLLRTRAHVPHDALALRLRSLTRLLTPRLGPAIIIDCARFMTQQVAMAIEAHRNVDVPVVVRGAIDTLVRPQLASLFGEDLRLALRGLESVAAGASLIGDDGPTAGGAVHPNADPLELEGDWTPRVPGVYDSAGLSIEDGGPGGGPGADDPSDSSLTPWVDSSGAAQSPAGT